MPRVKEEKIHLGLLCYKKREQTIVYKVVRRVGDKLFSLSTSLEEFTVQYTPHKLTKPSVVGTRLYVFTDLKTAKQWASRDDSEVWECSTDRVYKLALAHSFDVKHYWKARLAHKSSIKYTRILNDYNKYSFYSARCVDSLRLIKKVG